MHDLLLNSFIYSFPSLVFIYFDLNVFIAIFIHTVLLFCFVWKIQLAIFMLYNVFSYFSLIVYFIYFPGFSKIANFNPDQFIFNYFYFNLQNIFYLFIFIQFILVSCDFFRIFSFTTIFPGYY